MQFVANGPDIPETLLQDHEEGRVVFFCGACQGRAWKTEFPDESATEIRRFLKMFVQAFALPSSEYLQFNPNDRVLDVYRPLLNGCRADSLELYTAS